MSACATSSSLAAMSSRVDATTARAALAVSAVVRRGNGTLRRVVQKRLRPGCCNLRLDDMGKRRPVDARPLSGALASSLALAAEGHPIGGSVRPSARCPIRRRDWIDNDAGEYSGVYLKSKSQSNKPLADVDFSFDYEGDTAGGAPRLSIPLNTGKDQYAFIDALNCGSTGTVSTSHANCRVFLNFGTESLDNWDDLADTHSDWRIASGKIPFVIADQAGTYELSDIVLR